MKTFAALATAGSYASGLAGEVLVGRTVANTQLIRALMRHSSFERFVFFIGENSDATLLERTFLETGHAGRERVAFRHLLELPDAIASGQLSVLHHHSHADRLYDLLWLRDRHAVSTLPVTGQTHSLSYPATMGEYLKSFFVRPSACDALFCSSECGKTVLQNCLAQMRGRIAGSFPMALVPEWNLPIIPLGVDEASLRGGDGKKLRRELSIPPDAFVVLSVARFTEYDKMDLFPLLQAFRSAAVRLAGQKRPLVLLLAGARQGTKTPEMLVLWAKLLGVSDKLFLKVDFSEGEKKHLYAAADVFVSPCDNLQETYGLTVVEAMAAGLPVVVSDIDGYKETVADAGVRVPTRLGRHLGFLDELGPMLYERPLHLLLGQSVEVDLAVLEESLVRLALDEALREQLSKAARARVDANYRWSVVVAEHERVWRQLLAAPRHDKPKGDYPLGMDFSSVFAHYPTEVMPDERRVERSELARHLCSGGSNRHLVYPELRHFLSDQDILQTLEAASAPIAVAELRRAIAPAFAGRPAWHMGFAVTWLIKHGLLRSA